MDAIFKALNDPARRALLDSLRREDGQTLSQLEAQMEMTRFGVMKHLKVLEDAHLITTRKAGRFKHHHLNALPLQEVIDRWIEPLLAKPAARAVLDLKTHLEGAATMLDTDPAKSDPAKPDFVMATYIKTTHDTLWDALTRGDLIARYHFASSKVRGDYVPGGAVMMHTADGAPMLENKVISVDPKHRIEMEFQPHWMPDAAASRCVYLVEATPGGMKLTVEHYAIPDNQDGIADGWARFLSGLKTFLETGEGHRFTDGGAA